MLERMSKDCYIYTLDGREYGLFRFCGEWRIWEEALIGDVSYYKGSQPTLSDAIEFIVEGC